MSNIAQGMLGHRWHMFNKGPPLKLQEKTSFLSLSQHPELFVENAAWFAFLF